MDGKPVDAFQGAQPESKVEVIVDKMIEATPGNDVPKLLDKADRLFKDQKFDESLTYFEKLVGMDPGNIKVMTGLLRCLIQLKRFEEAREMFDSFDDSLVNNDEISKIKKLLDNSSNKDVSSLNKLIEEVKMNPQDKGLRYSLAESYLSANETEKGFNELLKLFAQDPSWNNDAAKKKMLEFFDLLGFNDPNVAEARKKLSSLMFK